MRPDSFLLGPPNRRVQFCFLYSVIRYYATVDLGIRFILTSPTDDAIAVSSDGVILLLTAAIRAVSRCYV